MGNFETLGEILDHLYKNVKFLKRDQIYDFILAKVKENNLEDILKKEDSGELTPELVAKCIVIQMEALVSRSLEQATDPVIFRKTLEDSSVDAVRKSAGKGILRIKTNFN